MSPSPVTPTPTPTPPERPPFRRVVVFTGRAA
jgi:hypothetical protein